MNDVIINFLKDPIQNIYIAAKHLSELCDKDYKGVDRNKLTDEQIRNIASRYLVGPDNYTLDDILSNNGYGQQVIDKKDEIMKALGYK